MKKIFLIMFTSLLILVMSGCNENDQNKNKKVLKVGMELAYPPFEMSEKDGTPSGVSVDFAKALGAALGKEVIIENIAWDGLIPSLKTGKVDLIISSMTITEERKKTIDFSVPYAQSSLAILANKNSGVKSIKDLNIAGKTVAVKKGSTGHLYAKDYLQNATVLVFDKEAACVLEVVQGKADGFMYDQLTIYKNYVKNIDTTVPLLESFQEDNEYWGVAMKKDSPLKKDVDTFIKQAKEDGTFENFANKYLSDAKKTFDELGIAFFF